MKHLKFKKFGNEARKSKSKSKSNVNDKILNDTLEDFVKLDELGQQKYSLGAGLFKLRISSKSGRGKSSGSRSILAFKSNDRTIWLHLFDKNEKENVSNKELKKLKILSNILLKLNSAKLNLLIKSGELLEVIKND